MPGTNAASGAGGAVEQPASVATIASPTSHRKAFVMRLILLEALAALVLLVGIVWWTMFSGRRHGELEDPAEPQMPEKKSGDTPSEG